jgi:hypothetical protein
MRVVVVVKDYIRKRHHHVKDYIPITAFCKDSIMSGFPNSLSFVTQDAEPR